MLSAWRSRQAAVNFFVRTFFVRTFFAPIFLVLLNPVCGLAASKPHMVTLGKATAVQWIPGPDEKNETPKNQTLTLKIRPLLVDGRAKEFTTGAMHDVTDRLFVVRRAFRLNDSLPEESAAPHWQWQRGGWLLIDRATGRISTLNLPDFDAVYSAVSWYRDYAAYCGVSDDGKKIYAMVAQIGRRKAVLKKALDAPPLAESAPPDSACAAPTWQRAPARVTFEVSGNNKQTFAVRGHIVDLMNDEEDDEQEEAKK
jgi:hypothetical protein